MIRFAEYDALSQLRDGFWLQKDNPGSDGLYRLDLFILGMVVSSVQEDDLVRSRSNG